MYCFPFGLPGPCSAASKGSVWRRICHRKVDSRTCCAAAGITQSPHRADSLRFYTGAFPKECGLLAQTMHLRWLVSETCTPVFSDCVRKHHRQGESAMSDQLLIFLHSIFVVSEELHDGQQPQSRQGLSKLSDEQRTRHAGS